MRQLSEKFVQWFAGCDKNSIGTAVLTEVFIASLIHLRPVMG
jgi:hypothetical protein